jgi:hypothetical protein
MFPQRRLGSVQVTRFPSESAAASSSTDDKKKPEKGAPPARKKRYAPKVRTGCITCRKRRVKCDENKPACWKCTNLGYHCDGYEPLKTWLFEPVGAKDTKRSRSQDPTRAIEECSKLETENAAALVPAPEMALAPPPFPFTHEEARSMDFYLARSGKMVAQYNHETGGSFWTETLPQAAHHFDSTKHILIALAMQDELMTAPTTPPGLENRATYHYQQSLQKLLAKMDTAEARADPPLLNVLLNCMVMFYLESIMGSVAGLLKHLDAARKIIDEWRARGAPATDTERQTIETIDGVLIMCSAYVLVSPAPPDGVPRVDWKRQPRPSGYDTEAEAQHALTACLINATRLTGQFPAAVTRANAFLDTWVKDYQAIAEPKTKESAARAAALERLFLVAKRLLVLCDETSPVLPSARVAALLEALESMPTTQLNSMQYRKPLNAVLQVLAPRVETDSQAARVSDLARRVNSLDIGLEALETASWSSRNESQTPESSVTSG